MLILIAVSCLLGFIWGNVLADYYDSDRYREDQEHKDDPDWYEWP